jgi:hypothetical protein
MCKNFWVRKPKGKNPVGKICISATEIYQDFIQHNSHGREDYGHLVQEMVQMTEAYSGIVSFQENWNKRQVTFDPLSELDNVLTYSFPHLLPSICTIVSLFFV